MRCTMKRMALTACIEATACDARFTKSSPALLQHLLDAKGMVVSSMTDLAGSVGGHG